MFSKIRTCIATSLVSMPGLMTKPCIGVQISSESIHIPTARLVDATRCNQYPVQSAAATIGRVYMYIHNGVSTGSIKLLQITQMLTLFA